jgi:Domain of Unknown Function (DUF1206)
MRVRTQSPENLPSVIAASGMMEWLSRIGYIAHGAIYIFIGLLAATLAWGAHGKLADPPSAIELIDQLPMGDVVVSCFAAGFVAYAVWRFVQAIADPDCQGKTAKGLAVRAGRVISGFGYAGLAVFAGRLAAGSAQNADSTPSWAYRLLTDPVGAFAGGVVAIILLGVAIDDVRKACTANFGERLKQEETAFLLSRFAGSWGFAARAVILFLGGVYLMRALFAAEPYRAKGFEGILAGLLRMPHGDWLLGLVALGLAAYGIFMVHAGIYRRHPS